METLQELINSLESKSGVAKSWKEKDGEHSLTYGEYHRKISNLSQGFIDLGIKEGDHVAYIANNNANWAAISLALNNIGAIDVPRGTDSLDDELEKIISHSDSTYLILENKAIYERLSSRIPSVVKEIMTMDGSSKTPLAEVEKAGSNLNNPLPNLSKDNLSTIIYTSGTTGDPKGVMLTQGNMAFEFQVLTEFEGLRQDDKWMSVLPPWHIFQRVAEYAGLYSGAEMFHSHPGSLASDLPKVKPTLLPSVPLVWESIYSKALKAIKQKLGPIGKFAVPTVIPNLIIPSTLKKTAQEKLGGNLRMAISGGGALPHHVDSFFRRAGIDIREGYGLTETTAAVSARLGQGKKQEQTVGTVIPGVDVFIADPDTNERLPDWRMGEVQVSGPNVMLGYYKNQEATDRVLYTNDKGQRVLKTGDKGFFDTHGNLKLKGRYKNIIVGPDGENIDPEELESRLNSSMLISQSVVDTGSNNGLYALIVPDVDELTEYCKSKNLSTEGGIETMIQYDEVKQLYTSELKKYNKESKMAHRIDDMTLADKAFEIGRGLTNTGKLKREEIKQMYRNIIGKFAKSR